MKKVRRINARGWRDAENRIERNLNKNFEGYYEVWIDGKLVYRVSNVPCEKHQLWNLEDDGNITCMRCGVSR